MASAFKRFESVGGAAFTGDNPLHIAFDGESDNKEQFAVAGADAHWVVKGYRFVVCREHEVTGKKKRVSKLVGCKRESVPMRLQTRLF